MKGMSLSELFKAWGQQKERKKKLFSTYMKYKENKAITCLQCVCVSDCVNREIIHMLIVYMFSIGVPSVLSIIYRDMFFFECTKMMEVEMQKSTKI